MSKEMSEEERGGPDSGDPESAPPSLFPNHCTEHANDPTPGNCGNCKDQREANKLRGRHLAAVPEAPLNRCIVHAQSYVNTCGGCEADRKGVSA